VRWRRTGELVLLVNITDLELGVCDLGSRNTRGRRFLVIICLFTTVSDSGFTHSYVAAHHKISSSIKGQQEAHATAEGDGEVAALPNLRRHPLPACQLGPAQRPGES